MLTVQARHVYKTLSNEEIIVHIVFEELKMNAKMVQRGDGDKQVPGIGFMLGGTAACMAVTFTNPWEVVKTRLQLQGELQKSSNIPKVYRGVSHAFYVIAKHEGIRGLQKGLIPAYFYQLLMNGVRFGGYEHFKNFYTSILSPERYKNQVPFVPANIMAGASSGILGAAIGSPFFMVKTRLQSYSQYLSVGAQHKYSGMIDAFKLIYRADGLKALMMGAQAAMLRTGAGSSVQLATYDKARLHYVSKGFEGIKADFAASLTSGFAVCVVMNPFDVVSTRLYNQNIDHKTHKGATYRGPLDCIAKTFRSEGVYGFYKGFFAHYFRIGPHTVLCFVFLEQLRRMARDQQWMK